MRIRKRFLSLSSAITSPPLSSSDPPPDNHNYHHQSPLLVQHPQLHPHNNQHVNQSHHHLPPSSSDHTPQIGLQPTTLNPSGNLNNTNNQNNTKIFEKMESEGKRGLIKTDDTGSRKESILCAQANNHDLVLKGWVHGNRLVPMKKKRGSIGKKLKDNIVQDNEMIIEGSTMKLKGKTNDKHAAMGSKNNEGVIMEGSRCSRVNGRGWRCSQQTLVGYSLCEHHLGKGRLRSMSRVRVARKEQQTKERKEKQAQSLFVDEYDDVQDVVQNDNGDDDDGDDGDEEFKVLDVESMSSMEGTKVFGKKRKLGMIKARSLSSLLSQISS